MKKRKGFSLNAILIAAVTLTVGLVMAAFLFVFMRTYRSTLIQSSRTGSTQAVTQIANTVTDYTRNMDRVMKLLVEAFPEEGTREEFMDTFLQMQPDVAAVTHYGAGGELLHCWAREHTPKARIFRNLSFNEEYTGQSRYLTPPHVVTLFDGYYPWVVTMGQQITDGEWLVMDLRFASISSNISSAGVGGHGYCFLMDTSGNIVFHPQQQLLYAGLKTEDTQTLAAAGEGAFVYNDIIYIIRAIPDTDWLLVGVSYLEETVTAPLQRMQRFTLLLSGVVVVIVFAIGVLLSRVLARPLQTLSNAMEEFVQRADDFTYQPVSGSREVNILSDSFGQMVLRIQRLMNTIRQEEENLRRSELKALQAQINPHFLYNTLDSIAWMCERGRGADAVRMVNALARLFRISISPGEELIPIAKELQHAESYLEIQKVRYRSQFRYTIQADPSCMGCACCRITLQPLIENAICHGFDLMVEEGVIEIIVRPEGGDVLLIVRDNGVGMDEETLAHLLTDEAGRSRGIGVKNVNDRIKITFGESYGLSIESEPDMGTTVTVRIPRKEVESYEAL